MNGRRLLKREGALRRFADWTLASVAAMSLVGCAGSVADAPASCDGFTAADCQEAVLVATRAVPAAIMARTLAAAQVERREAAEADMCEHWSVCEPAVAVAIVWLTYPGPGGNESWPVAVVRPSAGAAMVAVKPFPGAVDDRPRP